MAGQESTHGKGHAAYGCHTRRDDDFALNARTAAECVFADPGHSVWDGQCAGHMVTPVKCTVADARRVDRNVECCRANVGTRRKARFVKRIALEGHRHMRVAFDQRCSTHDQTITTD